MPPVSPKEALRRIRAITLEYEVRDAVNKTKDEAVKLNQKQLYEKGENMQGKKLKYKRPNGKYAKKKHGMNPIPGLGIADIFLTGETHKDMGAYADNKGLIIDSENWKVPYLKKKFGNFFGLNKESLKTYRPILNPIVNKQISNKTQFPIRAE